MNENPIFPTVEKWLGLYKNANCIFTNTYHGMLFCIIFKKQFLFFVQKGSGAAENDRFYSLMGNLNNQTWDELWNSPEAEKVRAKVRCCDRDCWMIGSVSPAMHKYIWKPATWVLVHKFKALFTKHPYSMYELKICRDYRDGKVTKEELDKCSTCDMNCVINNGLSEASKEQLKHKTGEEIVDADIAQQMETK